MLETDVISNGTAPPSEIARLEAAYAVIANRDGRAERKMFHWQVLAVLALVGLIGVGVWDHVDPRRLLTPFVQVVVQQEDGTYVSLGVPQTLLAYEPPEGAWLEMVADWVTRYRRRGTDAPLTYGDRVWLQYHTCGTEARRLLTEEQGDWKPELVGKTMVAVNLLSETRTVSPQSYQVLWQETTVTPPYPPDTQTYTGTLTTGRMQPSSEEMLMQNRLGLCITAYSISRQAARVSPAPSLGGR